MYTTLSKLVTAVVVTTLLVLVMVGTGTAIFGLGTLVGWF